MQEAYEIAGEPSLIAALGVQRVWQPQAQALFDVRVIDTDTPSGVQRSVAAVLSSAEGEKKKKYNNASIAKRASFTPFVVSVDGALGFEATNYLKHLSEHICMKWGKSYGEVMGWLAACGPVCHLPSLEPPICVSGALVSDGGVLWIWLMG